MTAQIGYYDNAMFVAVAASGFPIELALQDLQANNAHPEFFPRNLITNGSGQASYNYTGARIGTDSFVGTLQANGNEAFATKTWQDTEINITG